MRSSRPLTKGVRAVSLYANLSYGTAPTIGMIELSTGIALTVETRLAVPDDVVAVSSRLRLPRGEVTRAALAEMLSSPDLERAALELSDAAAQVIVFGCTTGSLVHGPGFDVELAARMTRCTGVPALTTATEVVRALRSVGATSIAIGTPYVDELNVLEREFFQAAGFEVRHVEGLQIVDDAAIARLSGSQVRALAESSVRDGIDALFLSCTSLPTLPILADLEDQFGIPVISSNAATLWGGLRFIDAMARPARLGSLLASLGNRVETPA